MCRIGKWKFGIARIYSALFYWRVATYEEGRLFYKYRILWLIFEKDA